MREIQQRARSSAGYVVSSARTREGLRRCGIHDAARRPTRRCDSVAAGAGQLLHGPFQVKQSVSDRDRIRGDCKVPDTIDLDHGPPLGTCLGGRLT
jgi:hypothetical protein